jgi:AcrR family transcriptional regulator
VLNPEVEEELPKRRTRADGRETAKRILDFAEKELASVGLANFNLDRVIGASGVSRSSVYHHFGGREGVISAVEAEYVRATIESGMTQMAEMLRNVSTGEEAFALVELGILTSGVETQKLIRRKRVSTLAMAANNPATMEMLRKYQVVGTARFVDMIRELRDRGLIAPVEPIEGTAYVIQSILLGRILVDLLDDTTTETQWAQSASATLRLLLCPQPPRRTI